MNSASSDNNFSFNLDDYDIGDEIGRGSFGIVYRAHCKKNKELVALKKMKLEAFDSQSEELAEKRFWREVKYTKNINHKNIVELKDYGREDDEFIFVLEYCNRGSVHDLLEKQEDRCLPVKEALDITLQALDGLEFIHNQAYQRQDDDGVIKTARGLVHRDIKLGNILIHHSNDNTIAKLADYGLAKAFQFAGFSTSLMSSTNLIQTEDLLDHRVKSPRGTYGFMSRWQMRDSRYVEPKVDVWSMAASLYCMLTGDTPRDFTNAKNELDMIELIRNSASVPIQERNPEITDSLAHVIDNALRERGELHYQTTADFKQSLLDCMHN